MSNELKYLTLKTRIKRLENSEKNTKCPGVLRKLKRQLRNEISSVI